MFDYAPAHGDQGWVFLTVVRWRQSSRDFQNRLTTHEVESVAELAALRARLMADPEVEWVDPQPWRVFEVPNVTHCPACGWRFDGSTNDVQVNLCQCGIAHVRRHCRGSGCHRETFTPPLGEGCGPIPHDAQGVQDQLYRRGGRKWRPA